VCAHRVEQLCKVWRLHEVSAKNAWPVLSISWQAPLFPQEPEHWTGDFPSLHTPVTISRPFMRAFRVVHCQFVSLLLPLVQHKYARSRSVLSCSPASSTDLLRALKSVPTDSPHHVEDPMWRNGNWVDIGSAKASSSLEERRRFRVVL
jgi:hypothetical protein